MQRDRRSLHLFKAEIAAWSRRQKLRRPWAGLHGPRRDSGGGLTLLSRHWPHLLCWSWLIAWQPRRADFGRKLCWRIGKLPHNHVFDLGPFVVRWQTYGVMVSTAPKWRDSAWAYIEASN